ncbi:MAG: NAD(P)/FAD-dependent oxidoreductase [Chloroflexi bacterium]|nr:MAG: NAD(P)/FAD-dependent oxidoreductase [Chloroflexota bacterium]
MTDTDSKPTGTPPTNGHKDSKPATVPHVVIVGGGFGGLTAAKKLGKQPVQVTLIDRSNYHLFQPMLYQVSTSGLAPADIAAPIRDTLHKHKKNTRVLMEEVTGVDTQQQLVFMQNQQPIHYEYLILATGASTNYLSHPEWESRSPGMKTLADGLEVQQTILGAFEAAEKEPDEKKRKRLLTFVFIGAGPTGVELAAASAVHIRHILSGNFQRIGPGDARLVIVQGPPRVLPTFRPELTKKVEKKLKELGVEIITGVHVTEMDEHGVTVGDEYIETENVFWLAGVKASPAGQWLGAEVDRGGRVKVQSDLTVPGHPNIFVIGDTACVMQDGKPLPGVAQPAMQGGHYAASVIADRVAGKQHQEPFKYFDKGSMAVVGRTYAVVESGPIHTAGFFGFVMWVFLHIYYLIGYRNRLQVLLSYFFAYFSAFRRKGGTRIIMLGRKQAITYQQQARTLDKPEAHTLDKTAT